MFATNWWLRRRLRVGVIWATEGVAECTCLGVSIAHRTLATTIGGVPDTFIKPNVVLRCVTRAELRRDLAAVGVLARSAIVNAGTEDLPPAQRA